MFIKKIISKHVTKRPESMFKADIEANRENLMGLERGIIQHV